MSFSLIRKGLVKFWDDSNTLSIPTAYPNADFDNTALDVWCAVYVIPAATSPVTLGSGGEDEHTGIFQISFFVSLDTGDKLILQAIDGIENLYYAGKKTTYSGQEILFTRVERGAGREVDGWFSVDVSIYYYARYTRSTS